MFGTFSDQMLCKLPPNFLKICIYKRIEPFRGSDVLIPSLCKPKI